MNGNVQMMVASNVARLYGCWWCCLPILFTNGAIHILAMVLTAAISIPANDTIFEDNDMMGMGEENRHSTIPLFNNRFAFVQDGAKNIILYDMVDNKAKSSYTQVNSYTPNNDYVFAPASGDYNIVGVNKKGMYGIISINAGTVQSVYPFEYKHIEKVGSVFVAKNQADKWIILGGNGTEYKNKIRGYSKDLT